LSRHPPETPAIIELWRAPLIGECVNFDCAQFAHNRSFRP
jgi:hypothetical protein